MKGKGLGVSVLFDESLRIWQDNEESPEPVTFSLPPKSELLDRVNKFRSSLNLTAEQIREIEKHTIDQDQSPLWYSVRRYRLTLSTFGRIIHMHPHTLPDAFIRQLLNKQELSTKAVQWGKSQEHIALQRYVDLQLTSGHNGLVAVKAGFAIYEKFPFLGATPDACVHDPS